MTGIKALERAIPTLPMKPGRPEKTEFAYIRHGTQSLIASFNVATGRIDHASIGDTRTEADLAAHLSALIAQKAQATGRGLSQHPSVRGHCAPDGRP